MIFETQRLRVRKLNFTDIEDFHKMQSDIEVMQYITGIASTYKESEKKLKEWIERYDNKVMEWPLAVDLKKTNSFIGLCGIIEENEIGYRFLPNFWRKGYGAEILNGLIVYAKTLGLKTLKAEVIIENEGSYKLLKRAGFKIVAEKTCPNTNLPEYEMKLKL